MTKTLKGQIELKTLLKKKKKKERGFILNYYEPLTIFVNIRTYQDTRYFWLGRIVS